MEIIKYKGVDIELHKTYVYYTRVNNKEFFFVGDTCFLEEKALQQAKDYIHTALKEGVQLKLEL